MRPFLKKALRILKYAKPHWKIVVSLLLVSLFLSVLGLVNPYLLKILIDDVLINKDIVLLFWLMIVFILIFIVESAAQIYYSYETKALGERIVLDVKTELFNHIERMDMQFHERKKIGDTLTRIDSDVYGIDSFIGIAVQDIILNLLASIAILIVCFNLNWKVTLTSLIFFPCYLVAQHYFAKKLKLQTEKVIRRDVKLLSFLQENYLSIPAIKEFLLERFQLKKYAKKAKDLINADLKLTLLQNWSGVIVGLITFTALLIILWYGSISVIEGMMTVGSLIALYTYLGKLFGPISAIGSINTAIQQTLVGVDRVFSYLDAKSTMMDVPHAKELKKMKGAVSFNNLSFTYDHTPILRNVSFTIAPGEKIALVGISGAGKSTIAKLIARWYDPQKGGIFIDDHNIQNIKLNSLRKYIGFISQDPIIFDASIKENIKMANHNASNKQVVHAAKNAYLHDFILSLPNQYHTKVGERGIKLSGGQKQRIAIARAFLKNPKIIIFDEATSSLDNESEKHIHAATQELFKNRTTIIIAHRLSTIRQCPRVIFLDKHKVAGAGSFEELMKRNASFARLYKQELLDNQKV